MSEFIGTFRFVSCGPIYEISHDDSKTKPVKGSKAKVATGRKLQMRCIKSSPEPNGETYPVTEEYLRSMKEFNLIERIDPE